MAWTFNTSGSAISKAGANANATIVASGSTLAFWSDEAESMICSEARFDLITNFATVTSSGKQILSMVATAYIAQKIIGYQPEAIGTTESTLRINLLENDIRRGLKQLNEDKVKTYLNIT